MEVLSTLYKIPYLEEPDSNPGLSGSKGCALDHQTISLGSPSFNLKVWSFSMFYQKGYFLSYFLLLNKFPPLKWIRSFLIHKKTNTLTKDFTLNCGPKSLKVGWESLSEWKPWVSTVMGHSWEARGHECHQSKQFILGKMKETFWKTFIIILNYHIPNPKTLRFERFFP